ncbi:MAG: hypothetical protein ACO1OO_13000 [Flavisolibacter sp.]
MSKQNSPIQFLLVDIHTEQFAILEENFKEEAADNVTLSSSFRFGYNEEEKTILASPRFTFDQDEFSFIVIEVACYFRISDVSWNDIAVDGGGVKLSKGFAAHLAAISTGVARGVMHAKTENTQFAKFLMPLLNVAENIEEDVVLK